MPLVDSFVLIVIAVIALLSLAVVLIGLFYPGSGADQLGWKPTCSAQLDYTNEIDDLDQMQAAVNAKRRARGAPQITHIEIQAELDADREKLRDAALEEQDLAQLLEARNSRRRARGEDEQTLDQFRRSLQGAPEDASQ